jgi:succinyl-diaminopimelate desuccinylase
MTAGLDPRALTRDLLAFNTINPPGWSAPARRTSASCSRTRASRSSRTNSRRDAPASSRRIGGDDAKPPICFTGHIDVVPLGAAQWTRDAFAGETDGDRMYGRGSTDMKGGIAAFVAAAVALAPKLARGPGLVLVITAGEEIGCEGAKFLADRKLLGRAGAIVVAEPTANYPYVGHKGLAWFEIETRGVTAHGSMPEVGENAIVKMAQVIGDLGTFSSPSRRTQ